MTLKRIDKQPTEVELVKALKHDSVGRNADVIAMLKTFGDIEGAFSIFVDSAWGDGKTFLVKQLELILRLQNEYLEPGIEGEALKEWESIEGKFPKYDLYFPIYFNAWENDDFEDPLLPLLATIATNCKFEDTKKQAKIREAVNGAFKIFAGGGSLALSASGVAPGAELIAEGVARVAEAFDSGDLLDAFIERIELRDRFDLFAKASLEGVASKVVIFIDELDRCRPRFAVKLLEQTKTLFKRDDVILVFSTETTQLAHAIRGLYGERFDAEKYLERFYDLKTELTPVQSIDYLRYLGFNDRDSYRFTNTANGFIRNLQPTMRDANRMVEALKRGQRYVYNLSSEGVQPSGTSIFANGALLPTLIMMEYEKPELWHEVKRGRNFSCVYEFGRSNDYFIKVIDDILKHEHGEQAQYVPNEEERAEFCELVCAYVFIDDYMDPRWRKSSEILESGYVGHVNKDAIRSLAGER